MNRKLRKRHLRVWMLMGLLLPVGFAAALAVRPPATFVEGAAVEATPANGGVLLGETGIRARLLPGELELSAVRDPALPDVLVYWDASARTGQELRGDEFLLGSFFGARTHRYDLPADTDGGTPAGGRVLLYSLAHAQAVAPWTSIKPENGINPQEVPSGR